MIEWNRALRRSFQLAFCALFVVMFGCASAAFSETHRILSTTQKVGGLTLPAGTDVTETDAGIPVEAILHSTAQWGASTLPADSRILFFAYQTIVLVPNAASTESDWTTASPGLLLLNDDSPDRDYEFKQCYDTPPWLTYTGLANQDAIATGALLNFKSLPLKELTFTSILTNPGFTELATSIQTPDFDLPSGTLIVSDQAGENAEYIYTEEAGRIGALNLPPHTFIGLIYPAIASLYTSAAFAVDGIPIRAGTEFRIDVHGDLTRATIDKDFPIRDQFVVPAGSTVNYVGGHLFHITLPNGGNYEGIPIRPGTDICFLHDGTANLELANDSVIGSQSIPAGSSIVLDPNGRTIEYAFLSKPSSFDGFAVQASVNENRVVFTNLGRFKSGTLSGVSHISGVDVKGFVKLREDGSLDSALLSGDQKIDGVPCMGDHSVSINQRGVVTNCVISGDYGIADSHFHRGSLYNGTFQRSEKILVINAVCVGPNPQNLCYSSAFGDIQANLLAQFDGLIRQHSGKFPFGNIGKIQSTAFTWNPAPDHIDFHQTVSVESMLTNPPFADCDVTIHINLTVKWNLLNLFGGRQVLNAWPSAMDGTLSYGLCPGTAALQVVANALSDVLSGLRSLLDIGPGSFVETCSGKGAGWNNRCDAKTQDSLFIRRSGSRSLCAADSTNGW